MKELSLNILDIAMNSVKAGAQNIEIRLVDDGTKLTMSISDDGCGMSKEQVENVMNPFFTTRTTRKVGMGVPLLKLAAEQTGGGISIESDNSPENHGTTTKAEFFINHIDCTPMGDVASSLVTLIQGSPNIRWHFIHTMPNGTVELDTNELKAVLGEVPLDNFEVIKWIEEYLREGYDSVSQ